jgi:SAM-dependent methyltransferase
MAATAIASEFTGSLAPRVDDRFVEQVDHCEPACNYCGGNEFAPLYSGIRDRLRHVPGQWSYVRCGGCGSALLRPFPRTEELPAFYPPVYTFSPELGHSRIKRLLSRAEYHFFFRPIYRAQARIIDRHLRALGTRPRKLLDIGCGRGLRLLDFKRLGYDVHGMDFVSDSVEYVQRVLNVPAVCTDASHLADAFEPESFDVVTAFHVIEHVTELDEAISAVHCLLRPRGWFVAAVPLIDSLQSRWLGKRWIGVAEAPRHVTVPGQEALRKLCRRHGFDPHSLVIAADSALSCAALIPLSLLPGSATTNLHKSGRWLATAERLLAAACTLPAWFVALAENYLARAPAQCIALMQKPASPT